MQLFFFFKCSCFFANAARTSTANHNRADTANIYKKTTR